MIGREAIFSNGLSMFSRWVSFISFPSVLWVLQIEACHIEVAFGFSQDRSGGDIGIDSVSFDDTLVGDISLGSESIPIDQQELGGNFELCDGPIHGFERGVQDIDLVDFLRGDHFDCPGQGLLLNDFA